MSTKNWCSNFNFSRGGPTEHAKIIWDAVEPAQIAVEELPTLSTFVSTV